MFKKYALDLLRDVTYLTCGTSFASELLAVARRYGTLKRAAGREVTLQDRVDESSAKMYRQLVADQENFGCCGGRQEIHDAY